MELDILKMRAFDSSAKFKKSFVAWTIENDKPYWALYGRGGDVMPDWVRGLYPPSGEGLEEALQKAATLETA